MGDATVRLSRTWSGIGIGAQSEQWNIAIDGTVVGSIASKETVEVSVEPGLSDYLGRAARSPCAPRDHLGALARKIPKTK